MYNEELKKNFSNNLVMYMREKRVSQYELANIIGVDRSSISRWVKMEMFPKASVITKLAKYFNIPESCLLESHKDYNSLLYGPYFRFCLELQRRNITEDQLKKLEIIIDTIF